MSRGALLWLLAHGVYVWWGVLALVALIGGAAGWRWARRLAAREAARRRAALGQPSGAASLRDGVEITLAGRIVCDEGEPFAVLDAGYLAEPLPVRETIAQVTADRLVLASGGERIELTGPFEIVVGSREIRRIRALDQLPPVLRSALEVWERLLRQAEVDVRQLSPGDPVWVSGTAHQEVVADLGTYRARPTRFRLGPRARKPTVALAFAGTSRPRARATVAWSVIGAAVFGLAFTGASLANGDRLVRRLDGPSLAAVGAAFSPVHGPRALEALKGRLQEHGPVDEGELKLLAAIYEQAGDCGEAAKLWMEHGQIERGAERAEACGEHALAAHAWYEAGEFARASDAWEHAGEEPVGEEPRRFAVRVHLLAGRTGRAISAARRLDTAIWGPWYAKDHQYTNTRAERARCIADALSARAGFDSARARLAGWHWREAQLTCTILLADGLSGSERLALIDARADAPREVDEDVPERWLSLLAHEADPVSRKLPPAAPTSDPWQALHDALPALEPQLALDDQITDRPPANGDYIEALRAAGVIYPAGYPSERLDELRSAIDGDGAGLSRAAQAIHALRQTSNARWRQVWRGIRILAPSIRTHRESAIRFLRSGRHPIDEECDALCELVGYRDLAAAAETLGDPELAATLRARAERFHEALLRRDIAVPLAVLGTATRY